MCDSVLCCVGHVLCAGSAGSAFWQVGGWQVGQRVRTARQKISSPATTAPTRWPWKIFCSPEIGLVGWTKSNKFQNAMFFTFSTTSLREGWHYQIGWIFGKFPNGVGPPLPLFFGKLYCNFLSDPSPIIVYPCH